MAVAFAVAWTVLYLASIGPSWSELQPSPFGFDFSHYLASTREWLAAGSPYSAASLAGPVPLRESTMPFLHPPTALPFFAAFLVLPAFLWWAIPCAILLSALWYWRPGGIGWFLVVACIGYPRTIEIVIVGNSDLWVVALVVLGLRLSWPAAAVLALKPSSAIFSLVGIRHRSWWVAIPAIAVYAVPFGYLWIEWATVVRNVAAGAGYLLHSMPLLALPIIARHWSAAHPPSREPTDGVNVHGKACA